MKVVENSLQNAQNYTILKKISWGSCPQTLLRNISQLRSGMYTQNTKLLKLPPPLRNPVYAPVYHNYLTDMIMILNRRCVTWLHDNKILDIIIKCYMLHGYIN